MALVLQYFYMSTFMLIEQLERDYPGITFVKRGARGEILLNEEEGELQKLLSRCEAGLPKY